MEEFTDSLRSDFLISYVLELIDNSNSEEIEGEVNIFDEVKQIAEEPEIILEKIEKKVEKKPEKKPEFIPKNLKPAVKRVELTQSNFAPSGFKAAPPSNMMQPKRQAPVELNPPAPSSNQAGGSIGMIKPLLNDPMVQSIECKGDGKPVLVKKGGRIQATRISLSHAQITSIIDEFSKNTRIPIVGGLLKAAFRDMLITAVTSEYSGSRFVIQKKGKNFKPY